MDRPPGINNAQIPTQPVQTQKARNPSDALEPIAGGRRSVFGRSISKIKSAFSHLRRSRNTASQTVPAATSLSSRKISAGAALPKPPVAAKPPHLVLEKLSMSISKGNALTREVKDGLVAVKNQYVTAGIRVASREASALQSAITERDQQHLDSSDLRQKLSRTKGLIKLLKGHVDDARITNADSDRVIIHQAQQIRDLPQKLGARLVALDLKPEHLALEAFHEEVRDVGRLTGEKGISQPESRRPAKPTRSAASVLKGIESKIEEGGALGREVKSELVRIENQYLASGLKFVRAERGQLLKAVEQMTTVSEDLSVQQQQLKQADDLIWHMEQRLDDSRIQDAGRKEEMLRYLNEVKELPHALGEQLVKLNFKPASLTLAQFHDGVSELSEQHTQLKAFQVSNSSVESEGVQSTQSYRELYDVQALHLKAAIKVVSDVAEEAIGKGDGFTHRKFAELSRGLETQLNSVKRTLQHKGGAADVSKEDLKLAKKLPEALQEQLVGAGLNEEQVSTAFRAAQVAQLNSSGWQTHEKTFAAAGLELTSTQQPASEMVGGLSGEDARGVFIEAYGKGEGVSCMDTSNCKHATNLLRSSFQINGKAAFNGVRHGILVPYGEKNAIRREQGAQKKAEEALIMALASKPKLYQQALLHAEGKAPMPRLLTTSTSLVTTGVGSKKEDKCKSNRKKPLKHYWLKPGEAYLNWTCPGRMAPGK